MQLVSVVMPLYNNPDYLEEAINSILIQNYRNIEFIIVDDGSDLKTKNILNKLAKSSDLIKIISIKKNKGIVNALNIGIDNSKGKYIARMDSDDLSAYDRISKQVFAMEKYNLDLCASNYFKINNKGTILSKELIPDYLPLIYLKTTYTSPFVHGSVMFKSNFIKKYRYKLDNLTSLEDYYLWVRIFNDNSFKFKVLSEYLYYWRTHQTSLSYKMKEENKLDVKIIKNIFIRKNKMRIIKFYFFSLLHINNKEMLKIMVKSFISFFK